jgi:hypothetical protein
MAETDLENATSEVLLEDSLLDVYAAKAGGVRSCNQTLTCWIARPDPVSPSVSPGNLLAYLSEISGAR